MLAPHHQPPPMSPLPARFLFSLSLWLAGGLGFLGLGFGGEMTEGVKENMRGSCWEVSGRQEAV